MSNLRLIEMSFAYEHAGDTISNICDCPEPAEALENGWYDLDTDIPEQDKEVLDHAVLYLDSRQLLERHPAHPHWVIIRDEGDPLSNDGNDGKAGA